MKNQFDNNPYYPSQKNKMPKNELSSSLFLFFSSLFLVFLMSPDLSNQAVNVYPKTSTTNIIQKSTNTNPIIVSHRGTIDGPYPEHSFAGYDSAIKNGSNFIEQDILLSADGVAYVSHDDNLKRVFNRKDITISKTSSKVLDKVKFPNSNEKLHRLSEVLQHYKGKVNFVIEAKHLENEPVGRIETVISRDIKENDAEDSVILQDSRFPDADYFHLYLPNAPILFLYLGENIPSEKSISKLPGYVKIIGVNIQKNYGPKLKKAANQRGIKYCGYSINSPKQNKAAINQKFDMFFTNNSTETIKYLEKNKINFQ